MDIGKNVHCNQGMVITRSVIKSLLNNNNNNNNNNIIMMMMMMMMMMMIIIIIQISPESFD